MAGSAWTNQILNKVIVGGVNGGIFLYTGTPGAGNPPIAWITNATTDPYGNALPANVIVSEDPASKILTAMSAGLIQVGRGTLASNLWGQIALQVTGVTGVDFKGIKTAALDTAAEFVLRSSSQNGLGGSSGTLQLLGTTFIQASDPADGISPEPWHTLGTLAGYTVTRGRYRRTIAGEVEFDISVTGTGANAASVNFSTTLAAPYLPTGSYTEGLTTNLAIASWTAAPPRVGITAAGVVSVNFQLNNSAVLVGTFTMPTD